MEEISSAASSVRPVSGHSDSPSGDGNYIFTPPKEEAEGPDRPRLGLNLAHLNDGLSTVVWTNVRCSIKVLSP